jgi:hypothetical protein
MVQGMEAIEIRFALCREFSMRRPLVRAAMNANAIQVLSRVYQLSHGCTYDMR